MSFASLHDTHDAKEQVRQAVDIVDLVGSQIDLRRQGRLYVGLCPWHDDSRPSLQVNPERQSWKCWVCDVGGDIFSFVMQREGVSFPEALEMLAERAGVTLHSRRGQQRPPGDAQHKGSLYQAADWAAERFHRCLLESVEGDPARQYLARRGITASSIERFRLGFSPPDWHWLSRLAASSEAITPAVLQAVGLLAKTADGRLYDRFRGRVIFPIHDIQGRCIAFGGRVLPQLADTQAAKYINSPETRLFSKSDQLYGLDLARDVVARQRKIIVVEGYTDVVLANQSGLQDVVAVLGTALGPRHLRLLGRFADRVTLVLDGDEAGQRRANEVLELFVAAQLDLRILTLPEGMDPCDFLSQHGGQAFRQLLSTAVDALEHKIATATRGIDPSRDTHQANRALEEVLRTMAQAPRLRSSTGDPARLREHQILGRLGRLFQVAEAELRLRLNQLRKTTRGNEQERQIASDRPETALSSLAPIDVELLEILAVEPSLAAVAKEVIDPQLLTAGPARAIYDAYLRLCQTSTSPVFAQVLTELDDPRLKNILVELDERAPLKAEHARQDAAERLEALVERYHNVQAQQQRTQRLSALQNQRLDEKEELSVLQQFIEQQRQRQGISERTDG